MTFEFSSKVILAVLDAPTAQNDTTLSNRGPLRAKGGMDCSGLVRP